MRDNVIIMTGVLAGYFLPCASFIARAFAPPCHARFPSQGECDVERRAASRFPTSRHGRNAASAGAARRPIPLHMANGVPDPEEIFEALMAGDIAGVEAYVDAGGDCGVRDAIGDTPMMLAVENEMLPALKKLAKDGGADVDRPSATTGETPLQLAAYYGYTEMARILVNECNAELEIQNNRGDTALSLACFWGNTDTVRFLLDAGADPNVKNSAGERPGDSFDAVFVPEGDDADGGEGGGETGSRRTIREVLEASRATPAPNRKPSLG